MVEIKADFLAAGGNRHPSAADWDQNSDLLVFGASNNVAVWSPLDTSYHGIHALLPGHTDTVSAIMFLYTPNSTPLFISGAADKTLRIWSPDPSSPNGFICSQVLTDHSASIHSIATVPGSTTFTTGAADGTVKIWRSVFDDAGSFVKADLVHSITLIPRHFPLCLAVAQLDSETMVLAIAGTRTAIQVYIFADYGYSLEATLTGHEAWIRSLSFTRETSDANSDLLLASASQDKYIRLWRIHAGQELPPSSRAANDPSLGVLGKSLSNKAHRFDTQENFYSLTFEALLLGHEDWIFTANWHRQGPNLRLLSASADNSLSIWEADPASGVWICTTRLGEISAQKGSTSATGSTGGFWIGLWSRAGDSVVSLGRTGSWRLWNYDKTKDMWMQDVAITGHTKEVKSACWAADHTYVISTGSDQTTRLFAEWTGNGNRSWHEFCRPQIHGYDLNCVSSIGPGRFVSGADEKLLRVFDEPSAVANLLERLCGIKTHTEGKLPDAANIPVLGLSNKAIQAVEDNADVDDQDDERIPIDPASVVLKSTLDIRHPPHEDHLARHLLWPETEKLYGHGYEISAVAASHNGKVVATACKASSIDHAVIRLYETKEWREVKPALTAHTLTVTGLAFSHDDEYLLSVSRDRQWAVFQRNSENENEYKLAACNPKGHSRMILDGAWAPGAGPRLFATAGRDKAVKIWKLEGKEATVVQTLAASTSVTAVAFAPDVVHESYVLAFGLEDGAVGIVRIRCGDLSVASADTMDRAIAPTKTVNELSWRKIRGETMPGSESSTGVELQFVVASDDASLRLFKISDLLS
ncbi:WD domain, G-beta repeat-containing protein [Pseudovirgaria hyperparasitica]|uniref:Elongator complex protein 2 n=1 Tax=Pseudovirgaria hyperparasitica TaxID=470096 RepID=A0A6A6WAW8_9PEZI|nr:WD domain, G-beta repeat-containing protein [Pseudovirgaria hyperparasitica]KAF2758976.1 WD domain, G-beta repeat-containing protein [Pseudovirgaria hyperparasitica]